MFDTLGEMKKKGILTVDELKESVNEAMKEDDFIDRLEDYASDVIPFKDYSKKSTRDLLKQLIGSMRTDKKAKALYTYWSKNKGKDLLDKMGSLFESVNESTKLTDIIKEALTAKDKKVVQAFYNQKPLEGKLLYTDGKTLEKLGMGRQDIAKWDGSDIVITAVMDSRSTQSIVKYLKKYIPSGILKK